MKGVIVQIGEPKSIVLYNNGRIGAIPTPGNCHVGMVVTVQYNNTLKIIALVLAAVLLVSAGVFIGERLAGDRAPVAPMWPISEINSGGRHEKQLQSVTVEQARGLGDDTSVLLTGNIVQSLGDEKYTFRDSTGDITVEIDRKIWRASAVEVSDTVEITGEVDIDKRETKIDVKSIRKK